MKMNLITNSKNDEYYTPIYAIMPLIEFLKPKSSIWCPFDTGDSYYVKIFKGLGFDVAYTHKSTGQDFFKTRIDADYIISNPPYSMKTEIFERLFAFNTPFAMLTGLPGLFESKRRFDLFKSNSFEMLYFNKRISFFKDYCDQKPSINPPFSSAYVCKGILPEKIVFKEFLNMQLNDLESNLRQVLF